MNSIVNKMSNTELSLIGMKPKDATKLDNVKLNTYPEENLPCEDRLYRYLNQLGEKHK